MTSAVTYSGSVPWRRFCHKPSTKPAFGSLPMRRTCHFGQSRLAITAQNGIWSRERDFKESKPRKISPIAASPGSSSTPFHSPSDTIQGFYACINEGKLTELGDYISPNCHIDECSFPAPFQDKKEVLSFLEELIASLGKNVKFKINQVCEGEELIAAANWHLEWKKSQIPFTRGCSFFECSKEGDKMLIKRAQIIIESPVKPGGTVLKLLKFVTIVFDNFPAAANWFLKYPDIVVKWLVRIYIVFYKIIVKPFLKSYTEVWKLTMLPIDCAFKIFLYTLKLFMKK